MAVGLLGSGLESRLGSWFGGETLPAAASFASRSAVSFPSTPLWEEIQWNVIRFARTGRLVAMSFMVSLSASTTWDPGPLGGEVIAVSVDWLST